MTNRSQSILTAALSAAFLLIAALPGQALAWGEYAHRTTASIAEANLTPRATQQMAALFRSEKMLATPQCALSNIGDASVWADCVRRDSLRWGHTAPWHYQTIDVCGEFSLREPCANGSCVTAQVERNAKLLADTTLPGHVRLEALAWLVHFTGDMHMPLHAGNRDDRGGNTVSAAYGMIEGRMNLHWLWDGPLAERAITDGPTLIRKYSSAEKTELAGGEIEEWSKQAWSLAADQVYPTAQDGPTCGPAIARGERARISNEEIVLLIDPVRLQIQRAGLRIARLINEALG